jgi:hypothetical protein
MHIYGSGFPFTFFLFPRQFEMFLRFRPALSQVFGRQDVRKARGKKKTRKRRKSQANDQV